MLKIFILVSIFVSFIKLNFFNSYVSTDFEVHRNWLAITNSLPLSKWYFDTTSQWTLDYPPLFAWFEYLLSFFAKLADRNMVRLHNLNYMSTATRAFQKVSVIITDFIYIYAVYKLFTCKPICKTFYNRLYFVLSSLKLLAPFGLLFIDHIHFQYNGFLYGILFLSFYFMIKQKYLYSGLLFAILLNFKHIYIYYAPAFGLHLLFHYCFESIPSTDDKVPSTNKSTFSFKRFYNLGIIVSFIFIISFGPFLLMGQIKQVFTRLFPFNERGLTHAYWAPNFWALYNFIDLGLVKSGYFNTSSSNDSFKMTRGLVEKYSHSILPSVAPIQTLLLTIAFLVPALYKSIRKSSAVDFLKLLIIVGWTSFQFGWHVHEKAILMVTLPIMLLELFDTKTIGIGFAINTIANFSLLPLVSSIADYNLKLSLFFACTCTDYVQLSYLHGKDLFSLWNLMKPNVVKSDSTALNPTYHPMTKIIQLYLLAMPFVWLFADWIVVWLWPHMQFLPLIVYSVYCSSALIWMYLSFYLYYWTDDESWISCYTETCTVYNHSNNKSADIIEKKCQ